MAILAILATLIIGVAGVADDSWPNSVGSLQELLPSDCDTEVEVAAHAQLNQSRVWVNADLLNWQPHMRSLDYAATEDGASLAIGAGRTHRVEFDRDAGFRVELGYLSQTGWGLGVEYTNFATDGAATVARPPGIGQLFSTLSHPGGPEEADVASVTTSLDYSTFDLVASSRLVDRRFQSFDIFGGVRWANIDHELNATFDGRDFVNGAILDRIEIDGFGLLLGGAGHWRIASGWFLFGRSSLAVLYGDIRNTRTETNLNDFEQLVDFEDSFVQPLLNVDARCGLGKSFGNVEVRVGYDMNVLTGVGDRMRFADDIEEATHSSASGDLLLEGLFVRIGSSW